MKTKSRNTVCLPALLAAAVCLFAFNARAEHDGDRGQFSRTDFKFVCEAAEGGQMEVELGRLAAEKATDPGVREFGQRMASDHEKAAQELKELATQKGATLPAGPDKKENKMKTHLAGLSGADFDKAYMKMMVKDHEKDVKEFQKHAEKADDTMLKAWATKTLPTLQEHLRLAQNVEGKVSGSKLQTKAD